MTDLGFRDLTALLREIRRAPDLDIALLRFARALCDGGWDPRGVSLVGVEADGKFRIRGMWTAMPSPFEVGQVISPEGTIRSRESAQRLLGGRPIRALLRHEDLGLLGDLVLNQGAAGWLVAPIMTRRGVVAVLALTSGSEEAITSFSLEDLERVAATFSLWLQQPAARPERRS